MMSSSLSALSMPDRMISYGFLLVGITILASVAFTTLTLLPNQFSAYATSQGENGTKLAFTSDRDVNKDIYVMNAQDGSNQTRLTIDPAFDFDPSWSPDGTKLAFTSDRDGNTEVYVMNAQDGSNQTRLTDNAASDGLAEWMHSIR
jgi:Tol biopolymer transport system component